MSACALDPTHDAPTRAYYGCQLLRAAASPSWAGTVARGDCLPLRQAVPSALLVEKPSLTAASAAGALARIHSTHALASAACWAAEASHTEAVNWSNVVVLVAVLALAAWSSEVCWRRRAPRPTVGVRTRGMLLRELGLGAKQE